MATPPQNDEAVPEYAARTKLQWVPCTTYPVPLPSLEDNWEYAAAAAADDDDDLPFHNMGIKWYDSNEDSYSSLLSVPQG